jgi:hypothetical protein
MSRRAMAALAAVLTMAVAACGSTPSPETSTAPTSTATASAPATASPTASPPATASATTASPGATVDPMEDISIAAPYTLDKLDPSTAAAFETQMKASLGALGSLIQVGARTAKLNGAAAGIVIAMAFPGIPGTDSPTFLDSIATGAAGSANGKTTSRTIDGQDVRVIETASGGFALYKHGTDTVIMSVGATPDKAVAVITAIIKATE